MLLVYFVIAAVPLGYLLGGRLGNYLNAPLRWVLLPCAAFWVEAAFGLLDAYDPALWLCPAVCLEYALLTLFIARNWKRRGMKLLALATLANFAVISANGFRMPVTPVIERYPELAGFAQRIAAGELPEYVLVSWDAPLWFLGDTLPMFGGLASVGDLLMAAGMLLLIVGLMRAKPKKRPVWTGRRMVRRRPAVTKALDPTPAPVPVKEPEIPAQAHDAPPASDSQPPRRRRRRTTAQDIPSAPQQNVPAVRRESEARLPDPPIGDTPAPHRRRRRSASAQDAPAALNAPASPCIAPQTMQSEAPAPRRRRRRRTDVPASPDTTT